MEEEKIIPEMVTPTSVCITPQLWHAYDNMATEVEVLDLLYALVIALKPSVILETGCYHGHATERLLRAATVNGFGDVYTCDVDYKSIVATQNRVFHNYPRVTIKQMDGLSLIAAMGYRVEFAFLDSGPDEIRTAELRAIYPKLTAGGVVAIHDTGIHGFLREKYLGPVLRELNMQHIYFDTPRGVTLCRKMPEIYP